MGIGGLIAGLIHFTGLMNNFTDIGLADALFNSLLGILSLICYTLLKKNNRSVIFVYGVEFLAILIYSPIVGRGFNFIMFVIGGILLWRLVTIWKQGELEKDPT